VPLHSYTAEGHNCHAHHVQVVTIRCNYVKKIVYLNNAVLAEHIFANTLRGNVIVGPVIRSHGSILPIKKYSFILVISY
jgi:hypothetical protein